METRFTQMFAEEEFDLICSQILQNEVAAVCLARPSVQCTR